MRAAIYGRVSTDDGRQDVENQLAELRRFAANQGWEIVAELIDHESGGDADRVEFGRLFKEAEQCRFDVVLFWALDRFTRDGSLETIQHLDRLTSYGVAYRSFNEPYLDTCEMFKRTIAKQERIRISEHVRAGLSRARAQGTRSGRPVGRPPVVVRIRDEAIALKATGLSWPQIAQKLGVGVTTVRRACQNPPDGIL